MCPLHSLIKQIVCSLCRRRNPKTKVSGYLHSALRIPHSVLLLLFLSAFQFSHSGLSAAPVAYSGKLTVHGFAHDGPGHFRFQLVDQQGNVLWSNSPNGAAVTTQVTRGHYSVLLGDDPTANMAAIPPRLFLDHPVVLLRVHFSEGSGKPFHHLQPDQRILSASHALTADTAKVADLANAVQPGGITAGMLTPGLLADLNASGGGIIQAGSITAEMLASGLLADLNASAPAGDGNGTVAAPAGSLIAVQAGQSAPAGYSLYQEGAPKTLVWEEKAPVSVARYAYDGVEVLDGKIYFVGGYSGSANNLAERYDPATNQWETLNPMSVA